MRHIVREWRSPEPSTVAQRSGGPRAEWLGETERERVRIVREWVQMTSQQRGTHGSRREDQGAAVHDHGQETLGGENHESQPGVS